MYNRYFLHFGIIDCRNELFNFNFEILYITCASSTLLRNNRLHNPRFQQEPGADFLTNAQSKCV